MKKTKLLKMAMAIVTLGTLLVGCGAKDSSEGTKYLIATDSKFAPFSFEENGNYKGIDVDILAEVAKAAGFEYELKPMDFGAIIPAIKSNQIDAAIAGMGITDERKESLDFSEPYFESGLSMVIKGDNTEINGVEDLNGKTVAVKKGTAGEKWALDNEKNYNLKVKHFEDSPSIFLEVQGRNSDFLLDDYPVIAYKVKVDANNELKIVGDKVTTSNYGFAVNKGKNTELMTKFQAGLKTIKENGKYDEILSKYIK
ncbi:transporter substrate-binding domain-containing protein [Clostridium gasigenes]|uniref:transporter substrate-binding domain-containing protein n=1 Tax=Clostridium gasigenes TaxID=94869 RepID=UPI00143829D4|nr:transporter substrate-binding domain-containing protein [Clostridium gasigenes]NKF06521.1 transporter substrate-binding domain-containing protein [Clostridium gasigenes]QSW21121.1 transporter substrate-binding domain-containing protein [Clostridium gasigenes]